VPFALYGTLLSLILASMVQFMRSHALFYAGVLQIHRELEEASALSGARAVTTFTRHRRAAGGAGPWSRVAVHLPHGLQSSLDSASAGWTELSSGRG